MPAPSAKASAKQAVVVHVHYEGRKTAKRSTRRRKAGAARGRQGENKPLTQGGGSGGPASSFSMPAQHGGGFYVHAPIPSMPRLVGENLGLGLPSSPYVNVKIEQPTVKEEVKTPGPAAKEEPKTPMPVKMETYGGAEKELPTTSILLEKQVRRTGPIVLGGRQESLSHVGPSRDVHRVIGGLRARFAEAAGHASSDSDSGEEGSSAGEAAPPLPPGGPQTRSRGGALEPPMGNRVYKGDDAQGRLLNDLQVLPTHEIMNWFHTTNGGNFLARAKKTKGEGGGSGKAIPLPLATAILEAHSRIFGGAGPSE